MPAPKNNSHAVKHGMTASKLPKGAEYISRNILRLDRELRSLVVAKRGRCDAVDCGLIQSAGRHETSAQLALRWLRNGGEEMPIGERLQLLRDVRASTDARDRCLERLDLRIDDEDFASLRIAPTEPAAGRRDDEGADDHEPTPDAAAGVSDDEGAD